MSGVYQELQMRADKSFSRKTRGSFYEEKAGEFLKLQGYKLLQKNFRTRSGEIDIICRDKEFISFVEVKARNKNHMVSGLEAVTEAKQKRIKKAALFFVSKSADMPFRFDVVEIIQGNLWREYNLIKDAFDYVDE